MVECIIGKGSQHGIMLESKYRSVAAADFVPNVIACNLVRAPKLLAA